MAVSGVVYEARWFLRYHEEQRQVQWSIAAQLYRNHSAIIALSQQSHCAIEALRNRSVIIAQSQQSHCAITVQAMRKYSAIIA
jgi:hypothetical protein